MHRYSLATLSIAFAAGAGFQAAGQTYVRSHDDVILRRPATDISLRTDGQEQTASLCGITAVARHGDPAPGVGGGTLSPGAFFNPAINNIAGRTAFFAQVNGAARNQGIFVADGNGIQAIVRGCGGGGGSGNHGTGCGDPSPIGGTFSGFFGGTVFAPDINNAGDVLFIADVHNGSAPRGLFLYRAASNDIIKIAAVGDPSPIGGTFGAVGPGSINNSGRIVFLASPVGTTNSNIFMWNAGTISKIAAIGDPAPGGGTFSLVGTESFGFADNTNIPAGPVPDINDSNQIVFRAIVSGGSTSRGIIVQTAGVNQWYVRAGDPAPGGGTYFDLQAASINSSGQIAFFADFQPQPGQFSAGWFAGAPGNWRKVLAFLDPIDGGQCYGLAFSRNPMQTIDDSGNVLLWANIHPDVDMDRMVMNMADGRMLIVARRGQPTPIGGTYGSMNAWPSLRGCRGTIGVATPGGSALNAHMVFTRCKPGDTNGDCIVNVNDLLAVINAWGPCPAPCPADLNGDGVVNVNDLLLVINNWG